MSNLVEKVKRKTMKIAVGRVMPRSDLFFLTLPSWYRVSDDDDFRV